MHGRAERVEFWNKDKNVRLAALASKTCTVQGDARIQRGSRTFLTNCGMAVVRPQVFSGVGRAKHSPRCPAVAVLLVEVSCQGRSENFVLGGVKWLGRAVLSA